MYHLSICIHKIANIRHSKHPSRERLIHDDGFGLFVGVNSQTIVDLRHRHTICSSFVMQTPSSSSTNIRMNDEICWINIYIFSVFIIFCCLTSDANCVSSDPRMGIIDVSSSSSTSSNDGRGIEVNRIGC